MRLLIFTYTDAMMRLKAIPLSLAFVLATQIGGCGDDTSSTAQSSPAAESRPMTEAEIRKEKERRVYNPTAEERAEDEARRQAEAHANDPVVTKLGEPGAAPAFTEYKEIAMGTQLVFLRSALTNQPISAIAVADGFAHRIGDYDLGDEEMSKLLGELVKERDQFAQRDIAKRLDPILQKHADEYKSVRYVKVSFPNVGALSGYDFDKQGFDFTPTPFNDVYAGSEQERIRALSTGAPVNDRGTVIFSDNRQYQAAFSNGGEFRFIKVTDEAAARAVEAVVKKRGTRIDATVYGYVESLQDGQNTKSDGKKLTVIRIQRVDLSEESNPSTVFYSYTN